MPNDCRCSWGAGRLERVRGVLHSLDGGFITEKEAENVVSTIFADSEERRKPFTAIRPPATQGKFGAQCSN
jgi:hypothetical protein